MRIANDTEFVLGFYHAIFTVSASQFCRLEKSAI